jgi:uncharacterized phage infection (PIP) family protein YhgE
MAKQIWVNLREARLLDQAIAKNDFRYLTLDEHKLVDKAYKAMKESELYTSVWEKIEKYANELVNTKCVPEWNKISEEMKPLGEKRNELAKKKASTETGSAWWEEDEKELADLDKQLSDLSNEYQKITDEANAELNEFKEKLITETEWACFFLDEKCYQLVGELVWRVLPTNK